MDKGGTTKSVGGPWSRFMEWLGAGSNIFGSLLEDPDRNPHNGTRDKKNNQSLPATADDNDSFDPDEGVNVIVVDNNFLFDDGGTPHRSEASATHGASTTDHDNARLHRDTTVLVSFLNALRFRASSSLSQFFFTEAPNGPAESQYATHYRMKGLSLTGSLVLLFNWVRSESFQMAAGRRLACSSKESLIRHARYSILAALLQLQLCGLYSKTE
ncbi:hypothetical protein FRC01_006538 [Tulasnella sp. 417]|nr:hypothetical protein FRC01_006538 [Tulasnella sp. 417]